MGSAGEQSDKKWIVNMNRLLGDRRAEGRMSEQQREGGEWRRRRGDGGRTVGLWANCGVELRSRAPSRLRISEFTQNF